LVDTVSRRSGPFVRWKNYSKFYWNGVYPYVKDALHYLSLTQEGKQIVANLYCNVFVVEHEQVAENSDKLRLAEAAAMAGTLRDPSATQCAIGVDCGLVEETEK